MFTPELVRSAWEAVGINLYNPDIIPFEKLAPSETSTIRFTTANTIHSTPVCNIMSAFSYFNPSPTRHSSHDNSGSDASDYDEDNPFLPSFTPRSQIHILQKSFASNSSTSYLVSKEPVKSSLNLVKPVHEKPYFIEELDWSLIQRRRSNSLDRAPREKLLERYQALEAALNQAKQQIRTHNAVIKTSHATVAILELQAQKLRGALHKKEDNQERKKKTTISLNVGDGVEHEDGDPNI